MAKVKLLLPSNLSGDGVQQAGVVALERLSVLEGQMPQRQVPGEQALAEAFRWQEAPTIARWRGLLTLALLPEVL